MIGDKGLTDAVYDEFDQSIEHHELMKVRIKVGDRDARDAIIAELCERSGSELVRRIGNIALLLRLRKKKSRITLPAA